MFHKHKQIEDEDWKDYMFFRGGKVGQGWSYNEKTDVSIAKEVWKKVVLKLKSRKNAKTDIGNSMVLKLKSLKVETLASENWKQQVQKLKAGGCASGTIAY